MKKIHKNIIDLSDEDEENEILFTKSDINKIQSRHNEQLILIMQNCDKKLGELMQVNFQNINL